MNRVRFVLAATLAGSSLVGVSMFAQQTPPPQAPEMKSVLAGKKFTPPVKGDAQIEFFKQPTKREGTTLVTKIMVKNTSPAPIGRLRIAETWYDASGGLIPGGDAVVNGLLQPGEIANLEIRTPSNPNMKTSMLQFTHANGGIPKPHPVSSAKVLEGGTAAKEPAAKTASATTTKKK